MSTHVVPPSDFDDASNVSHPHLRHAPQDPAPAAAADASSSVDDGNVEFFPRTPLYNDRVLPLSVLALLPLIPAFGNFPVAVVALVGVAATYLADMMNFRRTTIALLLATLAAIWTGFYLGNVVEVWNSVAPFVVLLNASLLMCLLAVWAVLHVRWVVLKFPEIAVRCERVVVGLLPFAALPSLVSTCAALAGSRHAAFVVGLALCAVHCLFFWRRPSSFAVLTVAQQLDRASDVRDICFVVHRPESMVFSVLALALPTALHCCFVWPTVSRTMLVAESIGYGRWLLAVNACGLVAIPLCYFALFRQRALWWMRDTPAFAALERHKQRIGIAAYLVGLFFAVSRVVHSRYAYYFVGFVPPLNFIMLLAVGAAVPVLVLLSSQLYERVNSPAAAAAATGTAAALAQREQSKSLWATCLGLSLIITVAFCMTLGMPPFFVLTTVCSVAALWAYLVDRRRNSGQYTLFIFSSALALLWWMFQSFSFIISDLKVFGEVGTIPAPLLAGSVLWVYIFGAWLIPLSFQKEAKFLFTIVLLVHSQKVMWIERVLYSQNEESTYPAHFVAITSIVGAATAYRLHTNEVLDAGPACAVMGAYLSKVLVYFSDSVEIDYRWSDGSSASAIVRETLLAYGAWGALSLMIFAHMVLIPDAATAAADESGAAAAATTAARAAAAAAASATGGGGGAGAPALPPLPKEALRRIVCGLSIASFLVFFVAAAPTLVRWLVEDVGRVPAPSRVQLLGCSLVLAVAASLYIVRALLAGASSNHSARLLAGLAVFFVAATLLDPPIEALIDVYASSAANAGASGNNILDKSDVDLGRRLLPDLPFMAPWWSRWVLLLALALALAIRGVLGMGRLPPAPVRFALWAALGVLLGLSVTGCNIIIADWKVYLCMSVYFCLTLIGFDQAHYSSLDNTEVCISLFIGGLVSFVAGIFMLNHVDIFAVTRVEAFLLDGVFASRIGAIGILAVMNFAVTAAIKCRAHGFSLMPRPTQLANAEAYAQLSLVLSAACVLGAVAWILLSMLLGQGSAPLVLLASAQLMLVEDRGWGFGLEQGMRRYLLPFIVGSFCMWVRAAEEIRAARQSAISNMLPYYGAAALCAPSQVIVMLVLWRGGSADASVARSAGRTARGVWALLLLAVDLLVVVMTLSANLRMVAALNLIGHITRLSLFEGVIVRARETLL